MSIRIRDLAPGMQINTHFGGKKSTFIGIVPNHPLYPGLMMVIWKLDPGVIPGDWSHDALDPQQHVEDAIPSTPEEREANLREAFFGRTPG